FTERGVRVVSLNGWQRLWVVLTLLWTLVAGLVAWSLWPARQPTILSVFGSGAIDPNTGTMPEISYYDALAHLTGWPAPDASIDRMPASFVPAPPGWEVVPGLVVAIPGVGTVRFPSSMSQGQVEAASKKLFDEHQKKLQ